MQFTTGEQGGTSCTYPCGDCEKCESGSCVADSSKNGDLCNSGAGTCNNGVCETTPTCVTSGECTSNEGLCPGYYCKLIGGSTANDEWCGSDTYILGKGLVDSLGTPTSPKTGYLSSPDSMTWDAAVNYCEALKTAINSGIAGYSGFSLTYGQLASLPSGCSMDNSCSALPKSGNRTYWLNKLCQWDCGTTTCATTDISTSCRAFYVTSKGKITAFVRNGGKYALCE